MKVYVHNIKARGRDTFMKDVFRLGLQHPDVRAIWDNEDGSITVNVAGEYAIEGSATREELAYRYPTLIG